MPPHSALAISFYELTEIMHPHLGEDDSQQHVSKNAVKEALGTSLLAADPCAFWQRVHLGLAIRTALEGIHSLLDPNLKFSVLKFVNALNVLEIYGLCFADRSLIRSNFLIAHAFCRAEYPTWLP